MITEEMILDGSGSCTLQLPSLMVKEITAAVVDGVTLDAQTLEWSKSGFVRATGRWTNRLRGVRLTVKHGFDAAPDVVEIIRSVAARAGSSPAGITREQAGQVSITYATVAPGVAGGTVLMEHERAMLEPYRLTGRL
ncbi:hypothetical protein [Psychromicrobium lacuslunae]|uniref:hypothetical protein n=1 Tax=Psychromicrobium lacuslunae TaxID=1618207 RepID=UPI000B24EB46|nr:hypothetical protein [Psychromicrobium lacuslunae]